jgi:tetratricopeptide (TPR) repeat protein
MYAEKFELLEAKIRETATLVSRLREEKRQLEHENEQLRLRIQELEAEMQRAHDDPSRYTPNLDNLLEQLDTLQADSHTGRGRDPITTAMQELLGKESKNAEEYFQLGTLLEQKGQFEQAISAYQHTLDVDAHNLEATQRLAFLLEKLNRDAEAAPLWDKIWAMRESQSTTRRRRSR